MTIRALLETTQHRIRHSRTMPSDQPPLTRLALVAVTGAAFAGSIIDWWHPEFLAGAALVATGVYAGVYRAVAEVRRRPHWDPVPALEIRARHPQQAPIRR